MTDQRLIWSSDAYSNKNIVCKYVCIYFFTALYFQETQKDFDFCVIFDKPMSELLNFKIKVCWLCFWKLNEFINLKLEISCKIVKNRLWKSSRSLTWTWMIIWEGIGFLFTAISVEFIDRGSRLENLITGFKVLLLIICMSDYRKNPDYDPKSWVLGGVWRRVYCKQKCAKS